MRQVLVHCLGAEIRETDVCIECFEALTGSCEHLSIFLAPTTCFGACLNVLVEHEEELVCLTFAIYRGMSELSDEIPVR